MTRDPLGKVERVAREAAFSAKKRDDAIREAHTAGATMRAIAEAAGVSATRVHQIVHGR